MKGLAEGGVFSCFILCYDCMHAYAVILFLLFVFGKSCFCVKIYTRVGTETDWKNCLNVDGVTLPTGYHFGFSAATGELAGESAGRTLNTLCT